MGGFVADKHVPSIIVQLDLRFQGDSLAEMVGLQKEFKIFSPHHSLASAAALLNLAPEGKDRRGWFLFLNGLKKVPSDMTKLNGHDRIVSALKKNLESKVPMQVHFTSHPASAIAGVTVALERPFSYTRTEYLTISAPTGRAGGGKKSKSA